MIIYRTAGPWGPGVGANLTAPQVDGNFYDISQRVQLMELNPIQPVQITSFTASGNQLFINMSDGTVQGPMTLPTVRWFFRGNWAPNTVYAPDDVIVGPDNAVYIVLRSHTSGTIFDGRVNDGQGHDYYSLLLKIPGATLPSGGGRGMVLTKNSENNYDIVWNNVPAPPGGQQGQVLQKMSDGDSDADWVTPYLFTLTDVSIVAPREGDFLRYSRDRALWVNQPRALLNVVSDSSWDPVVGDEGSFMVLVNDDAATSVTIPHSSVQDFPIGTELHIHQDGTGAVTVDSEPGVTILKHASFSNQLLGQYATATVKKTEGNTWRLFGLLAGA